MKKTTLIIECEETTPNYLFDGELESIAKAINSLNPRRKAVRVELKRDEDNQTTTT